MNKKDLVLCTYCKRHNWHKKTHCVWCLRKLSPPMSNQMVNLMITVLLLAVTAILSTCIAVML